MELEIVSRKDNPLLDRLELEVVAHHEGEPTPTRDTVREKVATAMKAKKGTVLVDHLEPTFGKGVTRGYVKVYKTQDAVMAIERRPLLGRNKMISETEKKAKPAPKEAPEEEPEAPDETATEEPPTDEEGD